VSLRYYWIAGEATRQAQALQDLAPALQSYAISESAKVVEKLKGQVQAVKDKELADIFSTGASMVEQTQQETNWIPFLLAVGVIGGVLIFKKWSWL